MLLLLFVIFFFSLGVIFDKTKEPIKSDVIVSLGESGSEQRIIKSIELYKQGFSNKVIITGAPTHEYDYRTALLVKNNISFIVKKDTPNTIAEVKFLKEYLLQNKLKTALIVSDVPHSRRIMFFVDAYKFKEAGLDVRVVATDVDWWSNLFLYDIHGTEFLFSEIVKYSYYNYLYLTGQLFKRYP